MKPTLLRLKMARGVLVHFFDLLFIPRGFHPKSAQSRPADQVKQWCFFLIRKDP